jgi:hypothetical protein
MQRRRTGLTVLTALALGWAATRADDGRNTPPAEDPDPSLLEFLGSVDRLAELNPDYLAQTPAPPPATKGAPPAPPPRPPLPPGAPGTPPNTPGTQQ